MVVMVVGWMRAAETLVELIENDRLRFYKMKARSSCMKAAWCQKMTHGLLISITRQKLPSVGINKDLFLILK